MEMSEVSKTKVCSYKSMLESMLVVLKFSPCSVDELLVPCGLFVAFSCDVCHNIFSYKHFNALILGYSLLRHEYITFDMYL